MSFLQNARFGAPFHLLSPVKECVKTDLSDTGSMRPSVDYRRHPERYRTAAAASDVLNVEPYSSELLPYLHFRGERSAKHAAQAMYDMFMRYRDQSDFVGMDMARKFLEMGWLRTRRYASLTSEMLSHSTIPPRHDFRLADASRMFYKLFQKARNDPTYVVLKGKHRQLYER